MINIESLPGESPLIDDKLKAELETVFQKLESEIVLKAVVDPEEEKGREQAILLKAVAGLSSRLSLELYAPGEAEQVPELNAAYLPVTGCYKDGVYSGVAFHGVPGGQEMNSFVLAIYNLAGPGQAIEKGQLKKIQKLSKPVNIKVCVSLACHHCPKVVAMCQQIAVHSQFVEAEMLDANLYPDLVEQYSIERVPVIIINDKDVYVGPKTMEDMLYFIKKAK